MTLETAKGMPHTIISNGQNIRRDFRVAQGKGKWSFSLQEKLMYIRDNLEFSDFDNKTISQVLEQQYRILDKLNVPYNRI
ncbi:hypothetical protein [Erwinia sp. CGal63]|uniref:hypothetical protein n=1 Tax=Erwinia sp. CGal63 TaxID=2919889 RepID=UPI00300B096C